MVEVVMIILLVVLVLIHSLVVMEMIFSCPWVSVLIYKVTAQSL